MQRSQKKSYSTVASITTFGNIFLVAQIVILLLFAIFVRMPIAPLPDSLSLQHMLGFLATNAMAVLGFGVFLSFGHNHQFTPILFALLSLLISWQLHILMHSFWDRIMTGFDKPISITMDLTALNRATRCGLASVVALAAVLGRISVKQLIKIIPIFVFGYTCSEVVIQKKIIASDPGGTFIVFTFASIFALVFSFILGKKQIPQSSIQQNYNSINFALIGTFILWICWPLFSCSIYPSNSFERRLIIVNTIFAMTGSCLSMSILTALYKQSISMLIMHRATVTGAVVIGASSHFIYFPTLSILFGAIVGVATFFTLRHLQGRCELNWGLYDTSGVLSYALVPSIIGGVVSAVLLVILYYNGIDDNVVNASSATGILGPWQTLQKKAGNQAGSAFTSLGLGALTSLISGFVVAINYREHQTNFYTDEWHVDTYPTDTPEQTNVQYVLSPGQRHRSSTRFNVPESQQRFTTEREEQIVTTTVHQTKGKKKFKTRYAI